MIEVVLALLVDLLGMAVAVRRNRILGAKNRYIAIDVRRCINNSWQMFHLVRDG